FFGRSFRELTSVFAMSKEKFQQVTEEAGKLSDWTKEQQAAAERYGREVNKLAKSWESLWIAMGSNAVPAATAFVKSMSDMIQKFKELDLAVPEWVKRAFMGMGTSMVPGLGLLMGISSAAPAKPIMPPGSPSGPETQAAMTALGLSGGGAAPR